MPKLNFTEITCGYPSTEALEERFFVSFFGVVGGIDFLSNFAVWSAKASKSPSILWAWSNNSRSISLIGRDSGNLPETSCRVTMSHNAVLDRQLGNRYASRNPWTAKTTRSLFVAFTSVGSHKKFSYRGLLANNKVFRSIRFPNAQNHCEERFRFRGFDPTIPLVIKKRKSF